jgi:hypothetical protein
MEAVLWSILASGLVLSACSSADIAGTNETLDKSGLTAAASDPPNPTQDYINAQNDYNNAYNNYKKEGASDNKARNSALDDVYFQDGELVIPSTNKH